MGSHYFRLTRDTAKLTLKQRNFYETSGFLVLPKLIPQQLLDKFSQRFDDIVAGKVDRGVITVMKDVIHRSSVNKLQDINRDDIFRLYIENKEILDIVECFTGKNIMAIHSMLIAKPPDIGAMSSRHPPHQDLYYFPIRPENKIVASWTAIEPCNTENGCLFVAPGSHLQGKIHPHAYPTDYPTNKMYHGIQNIPESTRWIDLEMEPGDTVFFHPLLIHGSGVNKSNCTRKAISCHYAAAECNYIEVAGTIQENIAKEVLEVTMRRLPGIEIRYEDVWKLKSSIARGFRSNL
ncbi:phytanoyl-CoA dioxygenase, peroxisomal isoform X1 [Fopius arisanus]|uniref:phytanoyl-CoA dioxygenase n=2 Tax=Fopius arisanus TaxID=64838 RepID=A0A9R1TN83_9HYME|nr:PREDICTED: phytanoyl-CoA dioxygenase, peroxisomal-like isoform X1 [Fopius arisanus]XP_011312027.1 PREDICTED: phytanoyl-CoA dioxygenase, peroxisomal-like isoform X1 [Fopius arisanus]XP_011312028.1 PREDICTED: phytanoyl-CoA dioxygenase, peroxisomal-like isoform X1 [Fopius arisanus]XP_011312029.1 PREDICTED: phytanoyl-CoA dioxygenase, peroxisomal-like isoform X1 [Fopius arisanus]